MKKSHLTKNELEYINAMWHTYLQRKFSNQSTDITVLMCYVMTADPAILKTDHVIDTTGAQNTSEVKIYIGHFFGDQ